MSNFTLNDSIFGADVEIYDDSCFASNAKPHICITACVVGCLTPVELDIIVSNVELISSLIFDFCYDTVIEAGSKDPKLDLCGEQLDIATEQLFNKVYPKVKKLIG